MVADLGTVSTAGVSGVVWSLPHGGDLDANLVRLHPGDRVGEHVNGECDVLVFVQSGTAELSIDGQVHRLSSDVLALIPRGARRELVAGPTGIFYLSIHRRRDGLTISARR